MNKNLRISFIGAGNMACGLIGGLLDDHYPAQHVRAADCDESQRARVEKNFGITTYASNAAAVSDADIVVLAVKPQVMPAVCHEVAAALGQRQPLMISIAAGIRCQALRQWLGAEHAIVRAMPNTPSLVGAGAAALFADHNVSDEQRQQAESILRAVGLALWLPDEAQMDAVTALSGSGPAYFFLLMEILERIGQQLGLEAETAHLLTLQTAYGASKMALESELDCAELRRRVTSPGGTTEQALNKLMQGNIDTLFDAALTAARDRSIELATLLGKS